jgi:hypothetical protein
VHGAARVLLASDAKKKVEEYVSNGLNADWLTVGVSSRIQNALN